MTEIESAYLHLASFMHAHFKGEPKAEDLRGLLQDAQEFRDDMNKAIDRAIDALVASEKR